MVGSCGEEKDQLEGDTPPSIHKNRAFIKEGQRWLKHCPAKPDAATLSRANDWKILTDISQQLTFLSEMASTSLRPDLVLWSTKSVSVIKLTVLWEDTVEEAYRLNKLLYVELAAEAVWLERQYLHSGSWM